MNALQITAHLAGPIALPNGPIALDGLLAAAVAMRDGIEPPASPAEVVPIEIPVKRSQCGRFHLASWSVGEFESRERRYINQRFPVAEAQEFGDAKLRRIRVTEGRTKSYRIPMESGHLVDDQLRWWCFGVEADVRELLDLISYLGRKRSVGLGRVSRWNVEPIAAWDGFPVMLPDGSPLRPLPLDWPGLRADAATGFRCLTYPYWQQHREEMLAVPEWGT